MDSLDEWGAVYQDVAARAGLQRKAKCRCLRANKWLIIPRAELV